MPSVAILAPQVGPLEADDASFFATNGLVLRNASVINFLDGCALSVPCQAQGSCPSDWAFARWQARMRGCCRLAGRWRPCWARVNR
jgi:hypothetical protein